jgi:hypothetical protein
MTYSPIIIIPFSVPRVMKATLGKEEGIYFRF